MLVADDIEADKDPGQARIAAALQRVVGLRDRLRVLTERGHNYGGAYNAHIIRQMETRLTALEQDARALVGTPMPDAEPVFRHATRVPPDAADMPLILNNPLPPRQGLSIDKAMEKFSGRPFAGLSDIT